MRALVLALIALAPRPGRGADPPDLERARVAAAWAPTFYQEADDRRDFITAFDFDGDWDGTNNAANLRSGRYALPAVVYYTVVETRSHWLIAYLLYHPVDGKRPSGHDHDTEHVRLVVRRDGGRPVGRLEAMETRFHRTHFQYAAPGVVVGDRADDVDGPIHFDDTGRPAVYVQRVGHGLCGGYAPRTWWSALALYCDHRARPHLGRRGLVYRYAGRAEEPRVLDGGAVGYALAEIGETLWPRAHAGETSATYAGSISFQGERCWKFLCPREIGARLVAAPGHASAGMPWEERPGKGVKRRGEAFFDPAWALSRRLAFPAPFSTDYVYNPYLGVGSFSEAR